MSEWARKSFSMVKLGGFVAKVFEITLVSLPTYIPFDSLWFLLLQQLEVTGSTVLCLEHNGAVIHVNNCFQRKTRGIKLNYRH
jgi:hypothetical protein